MITKIVQIKIVKKSKFQFAWFNQFIGKSFSVTDEVSHPVNGFICFVPGVGKMFVPYDNVKIENEIQKRRSYVRKKKQIVRKPKEVVKKKKPIVILSKYTNDDKTQRRSFQLSIVTIQKIFIIAKKYDTTISLVVETAVKRLIKDLRQ